MKIFRKFKSFWYKNKFYDSIRLGNYYPHKYANLTCVAQIEPSNHHDEYQSWIDLYSSFSSDSASASLLEFAEENAKYIRFDRYHHDNHQDFVSCQIELARPDTFWIDSSTFLFMIWIFLVLFLFYFMIRTLLETKREKSEMDSKSKKPKIIINDSSELSLIDSNTTQKETINFNSTQESTLYATSST